MNTYWIVIGLFVGSFMTLSQILLITGMTPDKANLSVLFTAVSAGSRWLLAAVLLLLALLDSVASGLLAFLGLWLARWIVVWVYIWLVDSEPQGRLS